MKTSRHLFALLLAACLPAASFALSDAEANAGRALVKRYADTIVGVELVVTLKGFQGEKALPPREQKREINGTVISANGLTVLSLGDIDPRNSMPPQLAQQIRFDEPEFKEVKLRLNDDTEIAARVVLKDADLDLAFVAPLPAAKVPALPFVDLAKPAKAELLGSYYGVSRGNKLLQRVAMIQPQHIIGIIEKPRQFLLVNQYSAGCPTFDAEGRVLGVMLRHLASDRANGFVILPAADVAEIAKEAAAAATKPATP